MNHNILPNGGEWLMTAVKRKPEGLLLLAAGACLLLRRKADQPERHSSSYSSPNSPQGRSENRSSPRGSVEQTLEDVREFASDAASSAKDAAETITTSARDYASQAARSVSEQSERVSQFAQSTARDTINRILKEQPLAIAAAGVAAGAVIAAVFPATDFERAHLGPYGEQLTDAAQRVGGQVKNATVQAGEAFKTATADGLKEVASEVVSTFGDTMKGAGDKGTAATDSAGNKGSSDLRQSSSSTGSSAKRGSDYAG